MKAAPGLGWLSAIGTFFQSIRFRLTLWTAAVLSLILIIFCLFIYSRQAYDLKLYTQSQLQLKAQQLLGIYRIAAAESESEHPNTVIVTSIDGIALPEYEAFWLLASDGKVVQRAGKVDDTIAAQLVETWQAANQGSLLINFNVWEDRANGSLARTQYIFLVSPLYIERHLSGALIIGRPVDPEGQLPRLTLTLLFGSLATLAVALAGGYWVASRAMAPVRTITRTARAIGEGDLHRRLGLKSRDELGELAQTFDEMLNRLQAAFDRQRQFTADASHELRTPLTIMGLEADQALEKRRSAEEYERAMRVVKSENEFMAHLVNDLLTLARMDAGQTRLRLEALDLSDLALEAAERLQSLARVKGVEITLGELPEAKVQGDRQFLSQALANLVENAIKYAGGRGKHVRIETGSHLLDGRRLAWIKVEDDGPGIAAEHLPHIFDRFYRADKARAREQEAAETDPSKSPDGSGLGLSIVQWIARAHSGSITARSEPGRGTTFSIEIPSAD